MNRVTPRGKQEEFCQLHAPGQALDGKVPRPLERSEPVEAAAATLRLDCFVAHKAPLAMTGKCRGDRIRTCDFLVPNQALYRAELRPELIQWSMPVRREPSSDTPCSWDEEDSIT